VASFTADAWSVPLGETWSSTRVRLPDIPQADHYRHLITGETVHATRESYGLHLAADDAFRTSPVALLWAPSVGA